MPCSAELVRRSGSGQLFLAVVFLAGVLFLARVFAADFFVAGDEDFLARVFAADFLVAVVLLVAFFAVDLRAGVLFVASVFAADFFVAGDEDFLARVFAADFLVAPVLAVAFFVVDLAAVDFFAGAALVAVDVALAMVEAAALGAFFAPETTAFRSAPARNFGTAVFFARVRSPVRGLRTMREGRTTFSKAPKPVMATFSPFATSRVIVPRTDSRACWADFLLPSKWLDSASMSWLLFKGLPFRETLRVELMPDVG